MLLSPEEHAACAKMPLASVLHESVGMFYPAIKEWRHENYTPDQVFKDFIAHMEIASSRKHIQHALFELMSELQGAAVMIPSRSRSRIGRSQTLHDDMSQVNNKFPKLRDLGQLAHLFYAITFEAAPYDLLRAVIAFCNAELAQTASDYEPAIVVRALHGLQRGWTERFCGRSLAALQEMLRTYGEAMAAPGPGTYYSRSVNIIQSSGTGKSRLMAALADHEVSVPFVFRSNGESGYPPGDPEIRRLLLVPPTEEPREVHARSLGLLRAIFDELATWLATLPPAISAAEVAKRLADLMIPPPVDAPLPSEPMLSDTFAHARSEFKKAFCLRVIGRAKLETARLREDSEWNTFFPSTNHHIPTVPYLYRTFHQLTPVQEFKEAALKVCEELDKRSPDRAEKPLVVLVFDEAKALVEPEQACNVYTAVRRILGCIDRFPVWSFFLSTNASLATLGRPRHLDQSSRIVEGSLHRVCSYYALPMNLGMVERFEERFEDRHKPGGDVTLTPLAQVGTVAHMTLYGRPLWRIYRDENLCTLRDFAMSKLLCDAVKGRYDPRNEGHVFAALAARISLDPCSTPAVLSSSADADDRAQAVKTAVDMHLRMIVNIDEATGVVTTTTPSEPAVSDAVAFEFACDPVSLWTRSIDCLVRKLLPRGIVDKGAKGELYARVLFVMAIDKLRHRSNPAADKDKPFEPVGLLDFLKELLAPKVYATLVDMQAKQETRHNPRRGSTHCASEATKSSLDTDMLTEEQEDETATDPVPQTVGSAFANAFVHFTRFVDTDVHMKHQGAKELLHMLFLQQAALQGAWTQPVWDLLIPVYMGDTRDAFDRAKVTALIVQIKNRTKQEKLKAMIREHDLVATFGSNFAWPVLFLVLELGIPRTEKGGGEEVCIPFRSFSPNVFQCTLFGALEETYAPLGKSQDLQALCRALLARTIQYQQSTIAESICYNNKVFRLQTFQEQFGPACTTTGDVPAAGNRDEKETAEGSEMCVD